MKSIVRSLIVEALNEAKKMGDLGVSTPPEIIVEEPRDSKLGDFSTAVAMTLAKSEGKNPRVVADTICKHLSNGKVLVKSAETAGPGFINLKMTSFFSVHNVLFKN